MHGFIHLLNPTKKLGTLIVCKKKLTDCINLFIYICFSLVHVGLFSNDLPQHLCPLSFQALPKNQQTHRSTEVEVRGIAKPPPLGEGWGSQISKVTGFFWTPNFGTIVCIHIRSLKSWCLEIWCKVTFGGGVQELWSNLSAKNYNRIGTLKKCYFRDSRVEFLAWNQHKPTKPPFTVEASGSWNV